MNDINLHDFRHSTPMPIRWADLDALGHVNNAKFLTYLEQARISYFNQLALWEGNPERTGLIMARVVIDYQLPLFAQDDIRVLTRTARLGGRSMDTHQVIVRRTSAGEDQIAANAMITVVVYDYVEIKSTLIPQAWRDKLKEYEPAEIKE